MMLCFLLCDSRHADLVILLTHVDVRTLLITGIMNTVVIVTKYSILSYSRNYVNYVIVYRQTI